MSGIFYILTTFSITILIFLMLIVILDKIICDGKLGMIKFFTRKIIKKEIEILDYKKLNDKNLYKNSFIICIDSILKFNLVINDIEVVDMIKKIFIENKLPIMKLKSGVILDFYKNQIIYPKINKKIEMKAEEFLYKEILDKNYLLSYNLKDSIFVNGFHSKNIFSVDDNNLIIQSINEIDYKINENIIPLDYITHVEIIKKQTVSYLLIETVDQNISLEIKLFNYNDKMNENFKKFFYELIGFKPEMTTLQKEDDE